MLPLGGALTTAGNGHMNLFRVGLMPVWGRLANISFSSSNFVLHGKTSKFTMPPGPRLSTKAHSFECNLRPTH